MKGVDSRLIAAVLPVGGPAPGFIKKTQVQTMDGRKSGPPAHPYRQGPWRLHNVGLAFYKTGSSPLQGASNRILSNKLAA